MDSVPESCAEPNSDRSFSQIKAVWIPSRKVVPNRILIVVFPELRLYGFGPGQRPFPELLRILEDDGAPGGGATMQKRKPIVIASGSAAAIEIGSLF